MPELLKAKIDLAKIHGAKVLRKDGRTFIEVTACQLFEGKNGALYLDAALFPTPNDQFGNSHRITQDLPRPIRDAGTERGPILGNAKAKAYGQGSQTPRDTPPPASAPPDDGDDVPF
jgi:hypothetical protein